MVEQELEIYDSNGYKNIYLKTRYKRKGRNIVFDGNDKPIVLNKGLEANNFVIVEKRFPEGMKIEKPTYTMFNCGVIYKGEECGFLLMNEFDHKKYAECGGIGDKVKITLVEEESVDKMTGKKTMYDNLKFELVE